MRRVLLLTKTAIESSCGCHTAFSNMSERRYECLFPQSGHVSSKSSGRLIGTTVGLSGSDAGNIVVSNNRSASHPAVLQLTANRASWDLISHLNSQLAAFTTISAASFIVAPT